MKKVKPIFTKIIMLITVATILLSVSCDSFDLSPVNCDKCYTNKPEFDKFEIKLTINDENPNVTIKFYEDVFYDANLVSIKTVNVESMQWVAKTDKEYVFEAKYIKDGRSYHVVNRGKLKTKLDNESCNESCYYVVGQSVDLRIKD
ncbi:MAG: hypothetical protein PHD06_08585 [Bacteroidales bacterium]|jgi:hypothetical protein|nr:hypothetical protein [Bacteroidales bacterium]MDY0198224.1 hypothetical protein [Tenuifilaceae bacterium]